MDVFQLESACVKNNNNVSLEFRKSLFCYNNIIEF